MARRSVRILNDQVMVKMLTATLPGPLAVRYYRTLRHWMQHKGPEWTALRLKALWNIALLLRSGSTAQIPQVASEARIACADGLPKGVEGALVRQWANAQRPSRIRAMAVPLRAYTAIRLTKESTVQVEKSRRSINEPGVNDPQMRAISVREYSFIREGKFSEKGAVETLLPFGMRLHPRQPFKLDNLNKLSGTSSYPNLLKIPSRDNQRYPYLSLAASLCTKGKVPKPLIEKFGDFDLRRVAEEYQLEADDPTYGRITIIQEGGAKGRVVCSPNAWVQYYCHPYHRYLMNVVTAIETGNTDPDLTFGVSCALDQVRGVHVALNHLNSGSFCHAVDLSSATDRFPLQLQQLMCEELGIPEFAQALEELKGPYWGLDGTVWQYGAGQPMGLYGSFPLFHLTHYCLLNGLAYRLGLDGSVPQFAVLGDDVLIFDEDLLRLYLKRLEHFKVPISWHKSYKGNLVEFAGFLITKSGTTWTAFRPYKYGNHGEMSSVLNVLHACGAATREWSNYWAKAFSAYQKTAGLRQLDLSPLAPEEPDIRKDEGSPGLGWFGSLIQRCCYYPTLRGNLLREEIPDAWFRDRYTLCQTQISSMDPFYYGETVPTDVVFDHNTFSPELYVQEDRARKRSVYQMFWKDPVVKAYQAGEDCK